MPRPTRASIDEVLAGRYLWASRSRSILERHTGVGELKRIYADVWTGKPSTGAGTASAPQATAAGA